MRIIQITQINRFESTYKTLPYLCFVCSTEINHLISILSIILEEYKKHGHFFDKHGRPTEDGMEFLEKYKDELESFYEEKEFYPGGAYR